MDFATDPNFPAGSDPWSGTPTRVAPSAGQLAAGFAPATQVPAQHLNWILGTLADTDAAIQATLDVRRTETFCRLDNVSTSGGARFSLTAEYVNPGGLSGFVIFGNTDVQVPAAGRYLVEVTGRFEVATATNPSFVNLTIALTSGSVFASSAEWRPNANTTDPVGVCLRDIITITTPGSQRIYVVNDSSGAVTPRLSQCLLSIRRIT